MTPATQALLSGAITFGIPLALAIRELLLLSRSGEHGPDPEPPRTLRPAPAPDDDAALPPLPACLIPSLPAPERAPRPRVLEDA